MLLPTIHQSLNELIGLLRQLPDADYCKPCLQLSNATIGEHTRHIIEMFQCLLSQYDSGIVNYDLRERNCRIQTQTHYAISAIQLIMASIDQPNKTIELQQVIDGENIRIQSNYFRELLYNLEHCVHHQALIKVALIVNDAVVVDDHFGVARSTIEYRNQCAQ
jgi:hypothetical protein